MSAHLLNVLPQQLSPFVESMQHTERLWKGLRAMTSRSDDAACVIIDGAAIERLFPARLRLVGFREGTPERRLEIVFRFTRNVAVGQAEGIPVA